MTAMLLSVEKQHLEGKTEKEEAGYWGHSFEDDLGPSLPSFLFLATLSYTGWLHWAPLQWCSASLQAHDT